ncbi:hypothetical protein [Thermofilum pendens]|uniref:Restriction endonuclease type IV Mrr domain-containing protein n=1 Tax=Thermofilum pendens (strain DSM 2475 / Hrk 5) TaxID=368408 RepID=A1RYS5_THEPD|nr:hypothetical protein [Thermofilum pendens]ABL78355.1 conserved hypothetical protein [Thermofilum pendens Hrk 5]
MTTARAIYRGRLLEKRYGVLGKVARRYLEAGLSVELLHPTRHGPIHVIARGNKQVLAIEVADKPGKVGADRVKLLLEKAKLVKAKPVLVLYSEGAFLDEEARKLCEENKVKVKVVKP